MDRKLLSDLDSIAQDITSAIENDSFRRHRRNFEILSGTILLFGLLGISVEDFSPFGIDLSHSNYERKSLLPFIIGVIWIYLLFRYFLVMKEYASNKRKLYINKLVAYYFRTYAEKITPNLKKKGNLQFKQNTVRWGVHTIYEYVLDSQKNKGLENREIRMSIIRHFWFIIKARFTCHYKHAGFGLELWMPYYIFTMALLVISIS